MTLEQDLLQLARDAIRSLMSGRDFAVGQTGHYLNIISRIEAELSRPKPEQEFYPDWDMIKPFHDRIAELEIKLAKPWVGLTQEERDELLNGSTRVPSRLIDWVEQKLKEKNT